MYVHACACMYVCECEYVCTYIYLYGSVYTLHIYTYMKYITLHTCVYDNVSVCVGVSVFELVYAFEPVWVRLRVCSHVACGNECVYMCVSACACLCMCVCTNCRVCVCIHVIVAVSGTIYQLQTILQPQVSDSCHATSKICFNSVS